ncbi:MarR family winged helix-turn-helix transcriptional regulator [Sanguibacter suaedae]|uniref:MarR family transcriptional regulator n=1 Tax=Sanguibacter suaedae TaxID=2795737 RepID=A0A934M7X5_9MICO|nr:MarR family transcriptional regulator [Sanguibacter suaedae]MBI9115902.1 MarR family transcriptional regulator [Sanguibacter suaedae]
MESAAPSPSVLQLDQQVCFQLYRGERAVLGAYRDLLTDLGLTYPQYLVLLVLWEDDGVRVSHIGARLSLESGTLSPLLRRMEQAGWVARTRDTDDERVVRVALTPEGATLRERALGIPEGLARRGGLDLEETATLAHLLGKLCNNLSGVADAPTEGEHHGRPVHR